MAQQLAAAKGKLQLNHYYAVPMTQNDIVSGIPESVAHCAIAHAFRSAGCGDPLVKTPIVSFNRGPYRYRACMDSVAIRRDWVFDDKHLRKILGPLQPMTIVVEVIDARPRVKLGTRASRGLPPKGPHPPRSRSKDNVCRPVTRRYHELQKFIRHGEQTAKV
jgi:hypothetical protein